MARISYVDCKVDRKSTSGTCQMLGRSFMSWSSKKQNLFAISMYLCDKLVMLNCYGWQPLKRNLELSLMRCLSYVTMSVVKIATKLVQHLRTKHIDIEDHFIWDHINKGDIKIEGIGTNDQLAEKFTEPLDEARFCKLRNELNIIDFSNMI